MSDPWKNPRPSVRGVVQESNLTARLDKRKVVLIFLLGVGFIAAGILHFVRAPVYVRMIPPPLAAHAALLVWISGLFEILGGVGVMLPQTRKLAALGLLLLLVAVFPANIYMALRPELFSDIASRTALLIRLPIQLLIMAWVWWSCLSD